MKKLLNTLFIVAISLASCNNEIINEPSANILSSTENPSLGVIENEKGIYEFIYKGESYSSNYEIINDSMIIEDSNVRKIVDEINAQQNVITYVHPDDKVEYIANFNEKDFLNKCEVLDINENASSTQALLSETTPYLPYVNFFEDSKLKGLCLPFTGLFSKPFRFKDDPLGKKLQGKLSSLNYSWGTSCQGKSVFVILYYQPDMPSDFSIVQPTNKAQTIYFAANSSEPYHYVHYLKSYKLTAGSSKNWNDRAHFAHFIAGNMAPNGAIIQ